MRPRLPSFGQIFRPPPSDGPDRDGETCEEDLGDGLLPIPGAMALLGLLLSFFVL